MVVDGDGREVVWGDLGRGGRREYVREVREGEREVGGVV